MTVHTFGDSHCYNGWPPGVNTHHVGPTLAFSVGRDGLDLSNLGLVKGDTLVISFGEIDCRCHVHKHVTDENPASSIIDGIVKSYLCAVSAAVRAQTADLKHVCIYNVPPPPRDSTVPNNPAFPFLGTQEDRLGYAATFNECVKKACDTNRWVFFNTGAKHADSDGYLIPGLSDGNVHISFPRHNLEFINGLE